MKRLLLVLFLFPLAILPAQESVQQALRLVEANDPDGARAMLTRIVDANDANPDAHFQLGKLLLDHLRDLDGAEEHLERAVELADNRADYHFTLGRAYGAIAQNGSIFTGMKYAGKVRSEFVRAVELEPDNVTYRTGLMRYYIQAPSIAGGSAGKAREQADAILRINDYEGHMAYAFIAAYANDQQSAEKEYRAAIAADSKRPLAHFRLGYVYLGQKRIDEAIAQFREYVRYAPDDPNSHDSLGEALLEKGLFDDALQEYRKALALNPNFSSSFYGTARCYEGKGMKDEALSSYRKYVSFNPTGESAERARNRVNELEK